MSFELHNLHRFQFYGQFCTLYSSRLPNMVPLPDSDDTFSSSEDEHDVNFPLHPKPELDRTYEVTVISAASPSNFYVSGIFRSFLPFIRKISVKISMLDPLKPEILRNSDISPLYHYPSSQCLGAFELDAARIQQDGQLFVERM